MPRRADALIPLSWDHHATLMVVRTILRTLAGDSRFGQPCPDRMREMVTHLWEEKLQGHFDDEESVFGTAARTTRDDALVEMAARLAHEHAAIAAAVLRLERAEPDELPARLETAANLLDQHVRWEERTFFPALEQSLPESTLQALGLQLVSRRTKQGRGSTREGLAVRGELFPDS